MSASDVGAVLNRLCKWRSVFAGWQLGTRANTDPESQAVRDHRELTILLRCEMNALTALLHDKGIVTAEEWGRQLVIEAGHLNAAYERRFPGFKASDDGIDMDPTVAAETMKGWRP